VVGNGPSLTISDLDRLQGEITFASNKIYLAFDETDWRPTYYSCVDIVVMERIAATIDSLGVTSFIPHVNRSLIQSESGVHFFSSRKNSYRDGTLLEDFRFSTDASSHMFEGQTVSYDLMQLAYFMGIRELYLIGTDHTWNLPKKRAAHRVQGEVLVNESEQNHFHPDYRPQGETWSVPQMEPINRAFLAARVAFERAGGNLFNATRGGQLEIFKRADLDEVLK
jgi:hypothetical protein